MHQAKFNKEARQWDVVDSAGNIIAMMEGGNKGKQHAERYADSCNAELRATVYEPAYISHT